MSGSFEVRLACAEDVADVVRLAEACAEAPHWPEEVYREMLRESNGALRRLLRVAVAEGGVVGFAVVALLLDEAEVESIAVGQDWRRHGVGRALMVAAQESAARAGAKALRLEVRRSNVTAQWFYASLGLVVSGIRRDYYSDPVDDAVLMRHAIL